MEKITSNLHLEEIKCSERLQFVVEEDKNMKDQSPDIVRILMEDGEVSVEEVRPLKDGAEIRGKLKYHILYLSNERQRQLNKLSGEIFWEEKIRVEGMEPTDVVSTKKSIEDIKCSLINSGKINIKALICLEVTVKEIRDEEIITRIEKEGMEQKQEKLLVSNLVLQRKDSLRMKEEVELPEKFPAIEQLLWKSMELKRWEVKPLEDRILIQWESDLFILYKALAEEEEIKSFEATVKYNTNLECEGSSSKMVENIIPNIKSWNIQVKEDQDGEDRILEAEMIFEPELRLYEEKEIFMITDVYGIREEMKPVFRPGRYQRLGEKQEYKVKLNKVMRIPASFPGILQICHIQRGNLCLEVTEGKEGTFVEGTIPLHILYVTEKEEEPFACLKEEIPFHYKLEDNAEAEYEVYGLIQEAKATILDMEEMEVKMNLLLEVQPREERRREYLDNVELQELSSQERNKLPTMAVYCAMEEETIWEIGKKYYISLDSIRNVNELETDIVGYGQKLLLIR